MKPKLERLIRCNGGALSLIVRDGNMAMVLVISGAFNKSTSVFSAYYARKGAFLVSEEWEESNGQPFLVDCPGIDPWVYIPSCDGSWIFDLLKERGDTAVWDAMEKLFWDKFGSSYPVEESYSRFLDIRPRGAVTR